MTNFDFTDLSQLNDVESRNVDALMKKKHIPAFLRWKWIAQASRDNARTPMQWSAEKGAGFTTGTPWLGINGNYRTVNYQTQENDPHSVLQYYRRMITLRAGSETLKYGDFTPLYADDRVMVYARIREGERLTVILNFSGKPAKAAYSGEVLVSNLDRTAYDGALAP